MISIYIVLTQWQYVLSLFLYLSIYHVFSSLYTFLSLSLFPPSPSFLSFLCLCCTLKFSCAAFCIFYLQNTRPATLLRLFTVRGGKYKHCHRQLIPPPSYFILHFHSSAEPVICVIYSCTVKRRLSCITINQHGRGQRLWIGSEIKFAHRFYLSLCYMFSHISHISIFYFFI